MTRRQIRVVGAMLEKERGRYLITQRRPEASLPLLWEFPGGRVEENETEAEALRRELREELGIEIRVGERRVHTRHSYTLYDIDFSVYHCSLSDPNTELNHLKAHDHRWVTLEEMGQYKFPDADAKTLNKLLNIDEDSQADDDDDE
jgi:8-oxo-dGTP diphosphatase